MKTDCSQKQLLNRIDQVSFAVNDMTLYLDTHPCDEKALTYCHELVQERKKLLKEYAEAYGPLIIDITDQTGEIVAEADRKTEQVILATFDLNEMQENRLSWGIFRDRRPECYGDICK